MKLLIVTGITEFDDDIKKMLKQVQIKNYSYQEVNGFNDESEQALGSNWFGSEQSENNSMLYYAFVKESSVIDNLFEVVENFNNKQTSLSKIHLAVVNIEKSN